MQTQKQKPSLRKLQKQISLAIERNSTEGLKSQIHGHDVSEIQKRLLVYHRGYWARLIGYIESDFPETKKLLGSKSFENLAHEFLTREPSMGPSLFYLPAKFAQYVKACSKLPRKIKEMAQFENLLVESFFSPKDDFTVEADLKANSLLKMNQIYFLASSSVRLFKKSAQHFVIYRTNGIAFWEKISISEYMCLKRVLKRSSVAVVMRVAQAYQMTPKAIARMTKRWGESQIIVGLKSRSLDV